MLYLGVDGGNTKTIALLATARGEIVGVGRAGCADMFHAPDRATALGEVAKATEAAVRAAGAATTSIDNAVFSLAGVDWPEDAALARADFLQWKLAKRCFVANDALGGLRAGTPDGVGIVIAFGTGGAIGARNAEGRFWHSGFWAEAMGGSELGQEAIRLVMRSALGIEPETLLTPALLTHFDMPSVEAVVRLLNGHDIAPLSNVALARLAPLVLDAAAAGDSVALSILSRQGRILADYARVAAGKVDLHAGHAAIVLTGGVFRHASDLLARTIAEQMNRPLDSYLRPRHEPALGALMLALEGAGIGVDEPVLDNLRRSAPDSEFYRTDG